MRLCHLERSEIERKSGLCLCVAVSRRTFWWNDQNAHKGGFTLGHEFWCKACQQSSLTAIPVWSTGMQPTAMLVIWQYGASEHVELIRKFCVVWLSGTGMEVSLDNNTSLGFQQESSCAVGYSFPKHICARHSENRLCCSCRISVICIHLNP